jgi:MFS family permease
MLPVRDREKYKLLIACLVIFVDILGYGIIIPILPLYADTLGATKGQIGFLFASYWIVFLLTLIPLGSVIDKYGTKNIIVAGMFLLSLTSFLYSFSQSLLTLTLSRILQGIAASCTWTAAFPLGVQATTTKKRGLELSFISVAIGLGTIAGPIIGGQGSFQMPLYFCGAVAFLAGGMAIVFIKEKAAEKIIPLKGKFLRIICQSNVQAACLGPSLVYFGYGMMEAIFPLYLSNLQYSRSTIGFLFGIQGVFYVLIQPLVGIWSDRVGRVIPMILGLIISAVILPLPFHFSGLPAWILLFSLLGIGVATAYTPSIPLIADGIEEADQGSAYAIYNTVVSIGFILGPWLGGYLAGVSNIKLSFHLAAVVLAVGSIPTFLLTKQANFKSGALISPENPS